MSKVVLISINPKWCELIAQGKKTIEVRKTKPKLQTPFKCYIYCTQARKPIKEDGRILLYEDDLAITNRWGRGKQIENPHGCLKEGELLLNGKVIGEFMCDKLVWVVSHPSIFAGLPLLYRQSIDDACLTDEEVEAYSSGKDVYGWHISNLVIYDRPKELGEFTGLRKTKFGYEPIKITRPPQSWCYVEEV